MKNKGFTLIELLAVIVILAIIALIAVPIIINIINGTKEKSKEISKDLYLKAVEQAILKKNLKEEFNPSTCTVQKDGNLDCNGTPLTVEVEGEKPCSGTITITKGLVTGENIGYCDGTQTEPIPVLDKLQSLLDEGNTTEIFEDGNGNIRYRGKTPNNYVTFNGEKWRIIGYVDNHIKLIKSDSMTIKCVSKFTSENDDVDFDNIIACLNPKEVFDTNTDGEYWDHLREEAKKMISSTQWYNVSWYSELTIEEGYAKEKTGTTWEGYVGLMYPSDYGYAASEECLSKKFNLDYGETCTSSNWLSGINEVIMTPLGVYYDGINMIDSSGHFDSTTLSNADATRPVINLKSEVKIVNGTGKEDDPYILELK